MKGLKILIILGLLFFVAGVQVNAANVTWGDYSFLYAVETNAANLYVKPNGFQEDAIPVIGATPRREKLFGEIGDPINSRADSIAQSNAGLNLELVAGASGDHLAPGINSEGGIKQTAYLANSSAQNGGILDPYGVEPVGFPTQQVTAFSVRRFDVDSAGAFNLNGVLTLNSGVIDADDFSGFPPPLVDYNYSGGITLLENVLDSSGNVVFATSVESIDLDDLLLAGAGVPIPKLVNLRTEVNGDAVSYDLKTEISLDSLIFNFSSGTWFGDIPEGALGFMGTEANPLDIEATLSQVPIPGSGILLLSGIAALIGYRRRGKSS